MLKEKKQRSNLARFFTLPVPSPEKERGARYIINSRYIIKKQSFQIKGLENVDFKSLKVTSHMLQ